MKKISSYHLNFLDEFSKFISATKNGKRTKKNGTKISKLYVRKLEATYLTLKYFLAEKNLNLRIKVSQRLSKRDSSAEKFYWKRFYQKFSDYLYNDLNCYDNYVGSVIKDIRTFFNYLKLEKNLLVGNFHAQFYVYKENIQILTLLPEQLNFLIHNKDFEDKLTATLKKAKDILVAGCTVALRYSDLINLKKTNLEVYNGQYYLKVQSKKTMVYTRIKLPGYVVGIIKRYSNKGNRLLPYFNLVCLNLYFKQLAEQAGWTNETIKTREKRGVAKVVYKDAKKKLHYRFCDLVSSHIMRRTAITTMLSLNMPENLVRKISGHAPNSKEFYKYVSFSQNFLDVETDNFFLKLETLNSKISYE